MVDRIEAQYREDVRRVFMGESDAPVFNGTIDHASIVIEEGFRQARHIVRILTKRLEPACWERTAIIDAARAFLERGDTELHIIVEQFGPTNCTHENRFLQAVLECGGERVHLRTMPTNIVSMYRYNFMTVDEVGYRFEEDRDEHVAVVAGGDVHKARTNKLITMFDSVLEPHAQLVLEAA